MTATKACVVSILGDLEPKATTWEGQEGAAQGAFKQEGLPSTEPLSIWEQASVGMFCGVSSLAFPLGETCSNAKGYGYGQSSEIMETQSIPCASTRANHIALDLGKCCGAAGEG